MHGSTQRLGAGRVLGRLNHGCVVVLVKLSEVVVWVRQQRALERLWEAVAVRQDGRFTLAEGVWRTRVKRGHRAEAQTRGPVERDVRRAGVDTGRRVSIRSLRSGMLDGEHA